MRKNHFELISLVLHPIKAHIIEGAISRTSVKCVLHLWTVVHLLLVLAGLRDLAL
jgi:hypothetical protein